MIGYTFEGLYLQMQDAMASGPLQLSGVLDRGGLALGLPRCSSGRFDHLNDVHRLLVGDLTEHNMLAIQPGRHDGGDEELRPVAVHNASAW